MLEFSLVFLLIFTLVYAVVQFGWLVYSYNVLAGATREATRYAMVHGSESLSPATNESIRAKVQQWSFGLDSSALTVNTTWDPSNVPGSTVRIQAAYTVRPFANLIPLPITIGSKSEMVISQ